MRQDARTVDAAPDAGLEARDAAPLPTDAAPLPTDAAPLPTDAAPLPTDAATPDATPGRSWQDVPEGPAVEPREVCSWSASPLPTLELRMPIHFSRVRVDGEGNALVAGSILESRDLGAGMIAVPWTSPKRGTVIAKFDASCKLLWTKLLPPRESNNVRDVHTLGFDGDRVVVLTASSTVTNVWRFDAFTSSSLEIAALSTRDGSIVSERAIQVGIKPIDASADVFDGALHLNVRGTAGLDLGQGPIADDTRGKYVNAVFSSDGQLQNSELFGGATGLEAPFTQAFGSAGTLALAGSQIDDYFGQSLGEPATLLMLDGLHRLVWKQELTPAAVTNPYVYGTFTLALTQQGSLAIAENWSNEAYAVARYDVAGKLAFRLPLRADDNMLASPGVLRAREQSFALLGSLYTRTRFGNSWIEPPDAQGGHAYALMLDEVGAVRWARVFREALLDIDLTPDDASFVLTESSPALQLRKLAR
ncbi:MAG: hypothetical protein ABW352_19325 [Polyangiales bacterium]